MISRRALFGTGAGALALAGAVGAGALTHRLDDVARTIGVKPKPRPVASDDRLIVRVAREQNLLLAAMESTSARHPDLAVRLSPLVAIGQAHVTAVGGSSSVPSAEPVDADPAQAINVLAQKLSDASAKRAKDAGKAVSPDLARVLSSMSASLAQNARTFGTRV